MSAPAISYLRGHGRVVRTERSAGGPALLHSAGLTSSCHREHSGCRTEMLCADRSLPKPAFIRGAAGSRVGVDRARCDCALWPRQG